MVSFGRHVDSIRILEIVPQVLSFGELIRKILIEK
jgi:hypothetical protein